MLSVELHAHSEASHDGRDPVEDLVDRAAQVGLDALAVTDHDEIRESMRAVDLAAAEGIVGIPGMEVTTRDGHVLALGVEELVEAGLPYEATLERIREAGGIAVIPHPFQETRYGVMSSITPDQLALADAVEVYNSRLLTGYGNRQARQFAEEHGLPMTGGSDAHVAEMVGRTRTLVDAGERSVDAILDAIREGRTVVEGKRTPYRISGQQAAGGIRRRIVRRLRQFR